MQIVSYKIEDLKAADYNPRRIDDEEFERLKNSIKEFGFVQPIIVNKTTGNIVGGHQRVRALQELEYKEVSVIELELSEIREKVLNLALNKIQGDWDFSKLASVFEEFSEIENFDIELTGFVNREADKIVKKFSEIEFEGGEFEDIETPDMETPTSHVKMVQLFLNEQTHPEFMAKVEALQKHYGTENLTETIERCVDEEFKTHIPS